METNIQALIENITNNFEFKSIHLNEFITFSEKPINIIISTKDDVNYMIFVFVDYSDLKEICKHIQIEIFTRLKVLMNEENNEVLSSLNKALDKNSTLIISTIVPNALQTMELNKFVSAIEEDSYYYKKQVLTFKETDNDFIKELLVDELGAVIACEKVISNIDNYEAFSSNLLYGLGDNKYQMTAMLYEKLPFLTLRVDKEERLSLQGMIRQELIKTEQLENVNIYRELKTKESINLWVDSIGVKND